ncbi:DNA-binding protein [Sphingobium sp. SCG-1]|nr:DNA-binding protein [Sphingobium sp. SCG-1]
MNNYFWTSGRVGKLQIRRCGECGTYHHPYQGACHICGSRNVGPREVSGRGTVVAVTINHQPWFPGVPVPYVLALVELEEQASIRLMTNLPGVSVEEAKPGMQVEVCFEQHGEIYVPQFRKAGGPAQ